MAWIVPQLCNIDIVVGVHSHRGIRPADCVCVTIPSKFCIPVHLHGNVRYMYTSHTLPLPNVKGVPVSRNTLEN